METKRSIEAMMADLDWLQAVIDQVLKSYLMQDGHENRWQDIPVPVLENDCPYAAFVQQWDLGIYERLALALAIAPHMRPAALDTFFGKNMLYDKPFTEFGGVADKNHCGFLPTGQTLCFLVTATEPALRTEVMDVLSKNCPLIKEQVIVLGDAEPHLSPMNGLLSLGPTWLHLLLTGQQPELENSIDFPAQKITTALEWGDVVLDGLVVEQVNEVVAWLQHGSTLMIDWGLERKIKPGYRALFYGPPGTGKTLTATLIGKAAGLDVYRVDLSSVVSKYIGETEKNLARIFDIAAHKKWILFFDEADSLFGKRTETSSSNDRYANQQTGYLLQRIEDFPGVVILASNLRSNMDEAFTRRFQSIIHFAMPSASERMQIWKNAFSGTCTLDAGIDLYKIAEAYELSGGAIINILRTCALQAVVRGSTVVTQPELIAAIRKEFKKENRTMPNPYFT